MRKVILLSAIIIATVFTQYIFAQQYTGDNFFHQGTVLEGLSMEVDKQDRSINYSVYLPPNYNNTTRSYPVVYLLHGYSDNETAWVQFGEVNATADRAIANREIPPMIIVMPDAGVSWYINAQNGSDNYEDIFIQQFIPFIDSTYRTRSSREFRAVAGLSMGGYGSLIYSLKHPDLFSSCAAFSAAVFTDLELLEMPNEQYNRLFNDILGEDSQSDRLNQHWLNHSVINLVNNLPVDEVKRVRFYIDNGDDDFLYEGNAMLHIALRKLQIPHQFRVRDGAHNWTYWRSHIVEGLKFIGEGFAR